MLPPSLQKLANAIEDLPGIGPRQAIRIAFWLTGRNRKTLLALETAIKNMQGVKTCVECSLPFENGGATCAICGNPERDPNSILIVEKETDLFSIEQIGTYRGRYAIMGSLGRLGVMEEWQINRLAALKQRLSKLPNGKAAEIIVGVSPSAQGDVLYDILVRELSASAGKITRLGRGLPTGGDIEFADPDTLEGALQNRK